MLRPASKAPAQKAHLENPMNSPHYIGFDVHKKTISFCVKTAAGEILEEGVLAAQRPALQEWAVARSQPWRGACDPSRGCTFRSGAADGRSVTEATMRARETALLPGLHTQPNPLDGAA